jgi:RNA polymerase sigma-70 factor (ECF subfamily)
MVHRSATPDRAPGRAAPRRDVVVVAAAEALTDAELVDRARAGDRWAEEVIYRRHVAYVGWLVVRLIGRHDDAEDVLQDVFTIAFEHLRRLRDGTAVRAWLTRIAVSRTRRRLQRRRLMRMVGLDRGADDATLAALAANGCSPETRAELRLVSDALATLPTNARIAWTLHRVEGLTLDEVARACGCSLATAKRRIAVADDRVRPPATATTAAAAKEAKAS